MPDSTSAAHSVEGTYASLTCLSQRLKGMLAPEAALPLIVETIATALQLPYAAIRLKRTDSGDFELTAEYGGTHAEAEPFILPLMYQDEIVGQLVLQSD